MDEDVSAALEELGITEDDFYTEAADQIEAGLDEQANRVAASWRSRVPSVAGGEYEGDIQIKRMTDDRGRPVRRVGDYHRIAHIIEYGSEDTDEHMVRAKVAQEFGNEGKYLI